MADTDPRLRILDQAASDLAGPVLAALDGTSVVIHLGPDVTGSARVAAGALAAMAARLFGNVTIVPAAVPAGASAPETDRVPLPANWWAVADIAELIERAAALLPTRSISRERTLTITVGMAEIENPDIAIGGTDYLAHLARQPVPVRPGDHHLGVHAAACLAISQVLGMVLREHGLHIVELGEQYQLDLLTHRPITGSKLGNSGAASSVGNLAPANRLSEIVFAGVGSVGSSAVALTATALAPAYTGAPSPPGLHIELVDLDRFDPARNPFRYPALVGGESEPKGPALAARLRAAGLDAVGYTGTIADWTVQRAQPGVTGLLVSSPDTVAGRLQVADVLAEQTLSIGVGGLELHLQRERMDGQAAACPFCDYVDTAPALTQADVYVGLTGLDLTRVLQLLDGSALLTQDDLARAVAAGKLPAERMPDLVGHRLADLANRVYAEAAIQTPTETPILTVAFPHVSWFAGVLAAVEIIKQLRGLPLLCGRVDVDLAGLPPGALRLMPPDPSGRCVCHSGVRRRIYRKLYGPTVEDFSAGGAA